MRNLLKTKRPRSRRRIFCKTLQEKCFQKGLILWKGGRWNNVARFLPALVITEDLLMQGLDIFEKELKALERK